MASKLLTYLAGFALASVLLSAIASAVTGSSIITIAAMSIVGWLVFSPNGRKQLAKIAGRALKALGVKIPSTNAAVVPTSAATTAPVAATPATRGGPTLDLSKVPTPILESESFYRSFDTSGCDIRMRFVSDSQLEDELRRRIHAAP